MWTQLAPHLSGARDCRYTYNLRLCFGFRQIEPISSRPGYGLLIRHGFLTRVIESDLSFGSVERPAPPASRRSSRLKIYVCVFGRTLAELLSDSGVLDGRLTDYELASAVTHFGHARMFATIPPGRLNSGAPPIKLPPSPEEL